MYFKSRFDHLPNELYLCIFDYLSSIDLIYSFSNLTNRITKLLKSSKHFSFVNVDLTRLNPHVFNYYCLQKQLNNQIESIRLTDHQFKLIQFSSNNKLRQLNIFIQNQIYFHLNEQFLFKNLQKLKIENNPLTWEKPLVICFHLKEVSIHLKNHSNLIELINSLPIIEKLHVTIDYDVTNCRDDSIRLRNSPNRLTDFSYVINAHHGLVYFVTDYWEIESLIKEFRNLIKLRLYIIGCFNTIIDSTRLEKNFFKNLFKLKEFHFFFQTYGGKSIESMDQFEQFEWNFGCYSNDLTDMHFLFTLPFELEYLDECINEYFLNEIKTTFQKSNNLIEYEKQFGFNSIKHINLSCSITQNLLIILRERFQSLESIHFSSSTAEYNSPPSLVRQSHFLINSIRTIRFDQTCLNQSPFIRLLPNLNKLIINQKLLNILLEETGDEYLYQITHLHIYSFQGHFIQQIILSFTNIKQLILKTTTTDDEGPIRSFIDSRCHHKHRPVSITDILDLLLKSQLSKLEQIEVGCCFERDEQHLQAILSRVIRKHRGETFRFYINSEHFQSTRCGTTQILFF